MDLAQKNIGSYHENDRENTGDAPEAGGSEDCHEGERDHRTDRFKDRKRAPSLLIISVAKPGGDTADASYLTGLITLSLGKSTRSNAVLSTSSV